MTLAEIIAAAKDNKELRKQIVDYAKGTEEGKEILAAFAKAEFEKNIKPEIAKIHKQYDDDIFEILGVRKSNDQNPYDFIKLQLKEFKALKDAGATDKDGKIKDLEKQIKDMKEGGKVNDYWKGVYDEALKKWETKEKELNDVIATKDAETMTNSISTDLLGGRDGLTFNEGITDDVVKIMVAGIEPEVLQHAKIVDGKVVYHKPNGEPWLNDDYKPITAKEIWAQKLGSVINKDGSSTTTSTSKGGGANTKLKDSKIKIEGEGENATKSLVLDKGGFSTKLEFQKVVEKAIRAEGIEFGTKEANDLSDKAYEEYGVKEMPFQ